MRSLLERLVISPLRMAGLRRLRCVLIKPNWVSILLASSHLSFFLKTAGIFLIEPDWSDVAFTTPPATARTDEPVNASDSDTGSGAKTLPKVSIRHIPTLDDLECSESVSCLQMTDTGLFVPWSPSKMKAGSRSGGRKSTFVDLL